MLPSYLRSAYPLVIAFPPESLSRITDSIVNAVLSSDLSLIYALLFSPQSFEPSPLESGPILVNVPDTKGWNVIHYCASVPNLSIEILDALYRAGADISLFTTSLPCSSHASDSAHTIHVAAEHGGCIDVLYTFSLRPNRVLPKSTQFMRVSFDFWLVENI